MGLIRSFVKGMCLGSLAGISFHYTNGWMHTLVIVCVLLLSVDMILKVKSYK